MRLYFFICSAITMLSEVVLGITKNNMWAGIFIAISIIVTIIVIVELGNYFYYDRGGCVFNGALSVETLHHFTYEEKVRLYKKMVFILKRII